MKSNLSYSDLDNTRIDKREYTLDESNLSHPVRVAGVGKIGTLSNVIDQHSTGLQMYVITDKLYKIAKNHPDQVKHITVLFRGSTGIDNNSKIKF